MPSPGATSGVDTDAEYNPSQTPEPDPNPGDDIDGGPSAPGNGPGAPPDGNVNAGTGAMQGGDVDGNTAADYQNSDETPNIINTHSLRANDDGTFVELDENGIPLGIWHYNDKLGEWVYDDYQHPKPLPKTGDTDEFSKSILYMIIIGILITISGIILTVVLDRYLPFAENKARKK